MKGLHELRLDETNARARRISAHEDIARALRAGNDQAATNASRRAMRLDDEHETAKARLRGAEAQSKRDAAAFSGPHYYGDGGES